MDMKMISAERLTFGAYRYRLEVQHQLGWMHWTRTYMGKASPLQGIQWYWKDRLVQGCQTLRGLDRLLGEALAAKACRAHLPAINVQALGGAR